jgi:sigma-E factor negative regulatory protein RseB
MLRRFAIIAMAVICGHSALADTVKDPLSWLERMSTAMSQMSYQGTFVFIQGERMETMRITHVTAENGVRERLVSLSGPPREVLSDANGVRWALGDNASVLADSSYNRPFFAALPQDIENTAGQSYAFKLGGESIIAGHTARNVKVTPRDHYRYGYSLWLEQATGLLLKWELVDTNRESLARLMFTDLRMGAEVDRAELEPGSALKKYKTVESDLPAADNGQTDRLHWAPSRLPPGFSLTTHRYHGGDSEFEHLVYSDGLAAVSVYVESPDGNTDQPELAQRHGTTYAYSCISSGMRVTVVGNVPAATVEMIGKSVGPAAP